MANTFLKVTGVTGESLDFQHHGEIEVHDWQWGMANSASTKLSESDQAKQTAVDHLKIEKMFDNASVTLAKFCAWGKQIKEATLTCRKNDGDTKVEYLI